MSDPLTEGFPEGENAPSEQESAKTGAETVEIEKAAAETFIAESAGAEVTETEAAEAEVAEAEVMEAEAAEAEVLEAEVVEAEIVDSDVIGTEEYSNAESVAEELPPKKPKYVGSADDYDEESHVQGSSITQKLIRQAELENEFKKSNRRGRAWSVLLMLSLIVLSVASLGILIRTGIQVVTYYSADAALSSESLTGFVEEIGGVPKPVENFLLGVWNVVRSVSVVLGIIQWLALIISLLITILLLLKITRIAKKQSAIHEELVMLRTAEQPHVKRFWYVLLAWLFGNFGLHFFLTDQKKRGVIFILLGFLGLGFWPLSLYTMSVSFYDGIASLYLPKEPDKKVKLIVGTGVF